MKPLLCILGFHSWERTSGFKDYCGEYACRRCPATGWNDNYFGDGRMHVEYPPHTQRTTE